MLAESGGLAPQPAEPIHLFSKQRPLLGGFTLQSGGEQWSCPTGLAARNGFQPITALRGFTLRKNGGGERSCSPAARSRPIRFKRVPAPRPVSPPKSPRGRICTCVDPLRRRRPELLGHAEKVDLTAGLPPTTQRCEAPHDCNFTTRGKSGPFTRTCTSISSFAGSRPVSWTMKGKTESRTRGAPADDFTMRRQSSSGTDSTSRTSASGSRSSFCIISNTRSLQPARQ